MIKSVKYFEKLKKDKIIIRYWCNDWGEDETCSFAYIKEVLTDSNNNLEGFVLIDGSYDNPDDSKYTDIIWLKDIKDIAINENDVIDY
jgi:hypothetical protein